MTGKVLDSAATGILVLILPIALVIVVIFTAWPYLLLLLMLSISWQVWQNYQWQQWCQQVNPYFSELITENQGYLTVLDLSLKTNMTGRSARRFLEKKAQEYGTEPKDLKDKGVVYYFPTASALGKIFEDSEPISELESQTVAPEELPQIAVASPEVKQQPEELSIRENDQPIDIDTETELEQPQEEKIETSDDRTSRLGFLLGEKPPQEYPTEVTSVESVTSPPQESPSVGEKISLSAMIQGDLAKRLDVHSSTVGKRKTDPDFSQWSQSKDPEGVAWKYSRRKKMYEPIKPQE